MKKWKIENLQFNNDRDNDGFFYYNEDKLPDPKAPIWLSGRIDGWMTLRPNIDIEYYQFKNEDGKILTMESLSSILQQVDFVAQLEDNDKFEQVCVFGDIVGFNHLIGRINCDSEFGKYVLRVFRGFWSNGAGIIDYANS